MIEPTKQCRDCLCLQAESAHEAVLKQLETEHASQMTTLSEELTAAQVQAEATRIELTAALAAERAASAKAAEAHAAHVLALRRETVAAQALVADSHVRRFLFVWKKSFPIHPNGQGACWS